MKSLRLYLHRNICTLGCYLLMWNTWYSCCHFGVRFFFFPLGLSKWIRQQLQHHGSFGSALESLHAFALRNQGSGDASSEHSSEFPSHSRDLSQGSQQEATIPLSPDVPAKSQEQNLASEVHFTAAISSVHPTASDQPSHSMATVKQSMFISIGNFKCGVASFVEETNVF